MPELVKIFFKPLKPPCAQAGAHTGLMETGSIDIKIRFDCRIFVKAKTAGYLARAVTDSVSVFIIAAIDWPAEIAVEISPKAVIPAGGPPGEGIAPFVVLQNIIINHIALAGNLVDVDKDSVIVMSDIVAG